LVKAGLTAWASEVNAWLTRAPGDLSPIYDSSVSGTLAVPRERGHPLRAYLARPDPAGPHPGVVVIHEAYGLNDNIREIADRVLYGTDPRPLAAVEPACPLVGSYPEKDLTARSGRELEGLLHGYAVPHDVKVYPGAHHSFFNDRGRAYDPDAAADAWQRTLSFFEQHLVRSPVR
jgi:dienelactone hydrolase